MTVASCPRCGYDLSGLATSWQDSCPLHGQCSECGLGLRWAEVLNPALTVPRWSFEHAPRGSRRARLVRTFIVGLRPRRFWSQLRLEHPVRRLRLAIYTIAMLLATHLFAIAGSIWTEYLTARTYRASWGMPIPWRAIVAAGLWPYSRPWPSIDSRGSWRFEAEQAPGYVFWFLAVWAILTPLSFLVLTDTLRQARVRVIHLVRAGAYTTTAAPALALLLAASAFAPAGGLTMPTGGAVITTGYSELILLFGVVAAAGWLMAYWWIVPRRYLRLPQPGLVSLAMLGLGAFGSVVVVVLLVLSRMPR